MGLNLLFLQILESVSKHHVLISILCGFYVVLLLIKYNSLCILFRFLQVHLEYDRSVVLQSVDDYILDLRCNRVELLKWNFLHPKLLFFLFPRLLLLNVLSILLYLLLMVHHLLPNRLLLHCLSGVNLFHHKISFFEDQLYLLHHLDQRTRQTLWSGRL